MKYIKLFENFSKLPFSELDEIELENTMLDAIDGKSISISDLIEYKDKNPNLKNTHRIDNLFMYKEDPITSDIPWFDSDSPMIYFMFNVHQPYRVRSSSFNLRGYTMSLMKSCLKRVNDLYDVKIFFEYLNEDFMGDVVSKSKVYILPRLNPNKKWYIKESNTSSTLLIVDVQKSFKKFFNDMYINELNKYCNSFTEVYQIFDNHHDGKNPDKDYLYDENPNIENKSDLYTFPNQKDLIEKRYRYDVDVEFFKKKMSKDQYIKLKSLEDSKKLKIGDHFKTNSGIILVFIGNNHNWFECPVKLYNLLSDLSGKEVTIVGGADNECLQDIFVTAESLGVKIKRDWKYIYSATHCGI